MAFDKYIKVKTRTGEEAVVMASLRPFYASQKAQISTPTKEEVLAAFPEERVANTQDIVGTLKAELSKAYDRIRKLEAELKAAKQRTIKQPKK